MDSPGATRVVSQPQGTQTEPLLQQQPPAQVCSCFPCGLLQRACSGLPQGQQPQPQATSLETHFCSLSGAGSGSSPNFTSSRGNKLFSCICSYPHFHLQPEELAFPSRAVGNAAQRPFGKSTPSSHWPPSLGAASLGKPSPRGPLGFGHLLTGGCLAH